MEYFSPFRVFGYFSCFEAIRSALVFFVFVLECPKAYLVGRLKLTFSHFKQNYTHFYTLFTHMYFKKLQTTLLKLLYQTPLVILESG